MELEEFHNWCTSLLGQRLPDWLYKFTHMSIQFRLSRLLGRSPALAGDNGLCAHSAQIENCGRPGVHLSMGSALSNETSHGKLAILIPLSNNRDSKSLDGTDRTNPWN